MIQIEHLSLSFQDQKIFEDFSYFIKPGEKVAITGKSGRGKSSLLNVILGFIPAYKGKILVDGLLLRPSTVRQIRKRTAWLPQDTSLNSTTVKEMLFTPFEFSGNKKLRPREDDVSVLFNKFQLDTELLEKKVKEISGGQKQRILLVSSLLMKKPILILDEPTSALDDTIKKIVTDHILQTENVTVLASVHDEYWINKSDKIIEL